MHHQTGHGGEGELPSSGKRCSQSALCQAWRDWEDLGYGEGCGETRRLSLTPWGAEGSGGALESGAQAQCLMYMSGRRVDISVQAQWFLPGELWLPAGRQWGIFLCLTPWLQLGVNYPGATMQLVLREDTDLPHASTLILRATSISMLPVPSPGVAHLCNPALFYMMVHVTVFMMLYTILLKCCL